MNTSGSLTPTTVLKAANIKTEVGSPSTATIVQQRGGTPLVVGGSPVVVSFFSLFPFNFEFKIQIWNWADFYRNLNCSK